MDLLKLFDIGKPSQILNELDFLMQLYQLC